MKKHGRAILTPLMLTLILSSCHAPADKSSCPPGTTVRQAAAPEESRRCADKSFTYQDYQVDLFRAWTGKDGRVLSPCLIVKKGEDEIYRLDVGKDDTLELIYPDEAPPAMDKSPVVDLTDSSVPNFVLMHYCAGNQNQAYIYSLGKSAQMIASLPIQGNTVGLEKTDQGTRYRLIVPDMYKDFGIQAQSPQVVLKWRSGKFTMDTGEMKKRCHDETDSRGLKDSIRESFALVDPSPGVAITMGPPELTEQVVDLFYGGQAKKARRFLDQSWPKKAPGKEQYWSYLQAEIKASPFWPQLREMNGLP
ncbi:MAG: hypothetical protein JSS83_02050 [Cyanobacteria bacterium SZAS LIN-3]|nr:hypothetical protein [Cyanobacteria bacterium SZAS LIN-3]